MEARADLEHTGDPAPVGKVARAGGRNAREELQQGGFTRAVRADYTDPLSPLHLDVNIVKRQKGIAVLVVGSADDRVRVFSASALCVPALKVAPKRARADSAEPVFF